MQEKGLIYREPNSNDGRGVLIFLTKFGKKKDHQSYSSFFIKLLLCSQKLDLSTKSVNRCFNDFKINVNIHI